MKILAVLTLICLCALGFFFLATRPQNRVVKTWSAPDGQYHLSVIQSDRDFRGFPLDVRARYAVYVGREAGQPTYGHLVDYSFTPSSSDALSAIERDIERCQVDWGQGGVTLTAPSGHTLFIPRPAYEGGR